MVALTGFLKHPAVPFEAPPFLRSKGAGDADDEDGSFGLTLKCCAPRRDARPPLKACKMRYVDALIDKKHACDNDKSFD